MSIDIRILNKEIDNLKETLYDLLDEKKLTDDNVVECSQELDKLILEYQRYKDFVKAQ